MGGVFAEFFLPGFGRLDFPDGFHLLAAIDFLQVLVVEGVAGLFVFGGPDDGFGGVGEIAAEKIGRRPLGPLPPISAKITIDWLLG